MSLPRKYEKLICLLVILCSLNYLSATSNGFTNTIAKLLFEPSSSGSGEFITNGNGQFRELNEIRQADKNVAGGTNISFVQSINSLGQHRSACQLVHVAHLLRHVGCQPKAIASFACRGTCPSYVQVGRHA